MDKSFAALLGAVGALASAGPAQAAPLLGGQPVVNQTNALRAGSYADLLRPIPNALAQLQALEQAELLAPSVSEEGAALYMVRDDHHHHHHHRRYVRHHHHHHHHHALARALNHILDH